MINGSDDGWWWLMMIDDDWWWFTMILDDIIGRYWTITVGYLFETLQIFFRVKPRSLALQYFWLYAVPFYIHNVYLSCVLVDIWKQYIDRRHKSVSGSSVAPYGPYPTDLILPSPCPIQIRANFSFFPDGICTDLTCSISGLKMVYTPYQIIGNMEYKGLGD